MQFYKQLGLNPELGLDLKRQTILFYQILSYPDFISPRYYFIQILSQLILSRFYFIQILFYQILSCPDFILFMGLDLNIFLSFGAENLYNSTKVLVQGVFFVFGRKNNFRFCNSSFYYSRSNKICFLLQSAISFYASIYNFVFY